ncbi:hypothetical protein PC110_g21652 [Phytophthora cactorum]|uniref:Uncharacterized protein n=1 Tax=Phytophthora cactorum TaxID=29920 RepID=A0A329RDE4_9STRA|nr:hypothetical protein PC110_g21652 [Phytophthora cactorum]
MSVLLPRTLLNRFYVILLVINCWSSVVAYSVLFKGDEASRRFVCIVLDCVLDLISCMGVELIIVLNYVSDYDENMQGFSDYLWRNDEWAARAQNEFRMVVVVSWSDLASRAFFSFGLISPQYLLGTRVVDPGKFAVRRSRTTHRVNNIIVSTDCHTFKTNCHLRGAGIASKMIFF